MQEDEIQNLNNPNVEDAGLSLPPREPSHEENKEKLAESLHRDGLIPNLRTYHGDVAEFIKNKDQTLAGIALKQNERKREERRRKVESERQLDIEHGRAVERQTGKQAEMPVEREMEKEIEKPAFADDVKKASKFSDLPTNFLIYVISICLIVGVVAAGAYLFVFKENQSPVDVSERKSIISAEHTVAIDAQAATRDGLQETFETLRNSADYKNGVTTVIISDASKKTVMTAIDLVEGLKLNMPSALTRTLESEFMLGLYGDATQNFFLILKIKDYGIAFRDMLAWEENLLVDFVPMLKKDEAIISTDYVFKDLIVKNKDTRAAMSKTGRIRLIYTFLNKETILLTESETALKSILDAFVAGNAVR